MNIIRYGVILLLLPAVVSGQGRPAFEVASIRPSPPERNEVTVGVRITGSQIRISSWPLKEYLAMAYNVRPQQISGPDWLSGQLYDIAATVPAGVSQEKIPEMLQALLAERFQLKAHLEKKDFPVYGLEVGKEGLKIKEVALDSVPAAAPVTNIEATGRDNQVFLDGGDGSTFLMANNRIDARRMTMSGFAGLITRFMDRPVVDFTGLTGRYDLTIDLAPEDYTAMMIRAAIGAGVQLPPQALLALNAGSGNPLKASMEKVGFRLESRNAPLDYLVVDSIAKAPTEN